MDGHMKMKAFQDSQGWHQAVLLSTMDGYWMTDPQGRLLEINESYCRMSGYSQQELLGMRIGDLEAIETVDQTVARILKIKNHGNDRFESYHRRKDGTVFPVEVSTQYLPADDGRYVVFVRDITDRKRLEKNLYDQRRRLESIIEGERVGTWEWNVQTGETVFNEAWAQIIGYTLEELAPISIQTWERFTHPDDLRESNLLLERHFSGVLPYYESECRMRHKDGHWVWVSDRGRVLSRSEDGKPLMMFGTHAEVTERKREEENLRVARGFSESIIEHAAEGVCVCHNIQQYPYVRFTVWNRRMQEITGYSMAEINRLGWYQTIYSDPVIREQARERMERMRTGDDLHNEGWEITRSDGQRRFLEVNTTILPSHDGQTHVLALMHDITEHKRAEQKLAQEAIRRRILIEQSRDGIVVLDQNGKVCEANQRYAGMLGYTAEEVRELYVWDWDLQWSRDELLEMIRLVDPAGDHFETRHRRKDGTSFDVEVSTNGAVIGEKKLVFCVCRDITERKKAEEKLRASEEKYRGIFDCSIAAIYLFDQDKHFIDSNQAGLDLLGYSREELLQMSIPDVDADPVVVLPAHAELLSGGRLINYEHQLRRKDKSIITVLNNSMPLTESNGNVIGMLSTLLDITERKQAEEALNAENARFNTLMAVSSDGIAIINQEHKVVKTNRRFAEMLGYTLEEVLMLNTWDFEATMTEAQIRKDFKDLTQINCTFQSKHRRKDGSTYDVEVCAGGAMVFNEPMVLTLSRDITERKKAQAALQESEARFRALFDNSPDGVLVLDGTSRRCLLSNAQICRMLDYSQEELSKKWLDDIHPVAHLPRIAAEFERFMRGEITFTPEVPVLRRDGSTLLVDISGCRFEMDGHKCALGLFRDVTERKKAEEALKESQNRYRAVFENSADAIFLTRTDGSILSCNDAACRMFGRSQEELVKVGRNGVIDAEDSRLAAALAERTSTGLFKGELECIRQDGSKFPGEITSAVFQNTSESSLTCTIIRDISERKQAEKRSLIQLELALGLASVSSLTVGLQLCLDAALKVGEFDAGGFYLVDERSGDLDLVTQRGLSQDFVKAAMHYDSESKNAQLVMAGKPAYKRHKKLGFDLTEPEDREGWRFLAVIPIRDDERVIGCLNVASRSVNDLPSSSRESLETIAAEAAHAIARLRAQEALHDSHSLLAATLESTADGLLVVDADGRITRFNRRFLELWRIPESFAATQDESRLLQFVLDQIKDPEAFLAKIHNLYQNPADSSWDELVFRDGRIFERYSQPQRLGENIVGRVWSFRDITERKRAENKIKASETFIRDVIDSLSSSLAVLDQHGTIIDVNASWKRLATDNGCRDRNFYIGTNYLDVCEKAAATGLGIELMEIAGGIRSVIDRSESSYSREYPCQTPSGDRWSRMNVFPLNTPEAGAVIIHDDISAQKQAESSILNALEEKQVLLQEIHHRVKNNLQVVIGLLGLQTGQLKNPTVKEALQVSQQRIKVMAMIHETLHQGQNLASIGLAGFLMKLTQQLKNAFNQHANIYVTVEAEEIVLKMDQAIPCGLIVNELVTNALKYAFPGNASGQVHIKASRIGGSRIELTVTDNGIGLPPSVDLTRPSSLGLRMVRGLVEHQLSGSFYASVSGGTTFVMRWVL